MNINQILYAQLLSEVVNKKIRQTGFLHKELHYEETIILGDNVGV